MSDDQTRKNLQDIVGILHGMLQVMAKANVEHSFLLAHLADKGILSPDDLKHLEQAVAKQTKQAVTDSENTLEGRLLDLLRKFEGPPQ